MVSVTYLMYCILVSVMGKLTLWNKEHYVAN